MSDVPPTDDARRQGLKRKTLHQAEEAWVYTNQTSGTAPEAPIRLYAIPHPRLSRHFTEAMLLAPVPPDDTPSSPGTPSPAPKRPRLGDRTDDDDVEIIDLTGDDDTDDDGDRVSVAVQQGSPVIDLTNEDDDAVEEVMIQEEEEDPRVSL